MFHFQPRIAAPVGEGAADGAFLNFVVAIIGVIATETNSGNPGEGVAVFTTGIHPAAGQVHIGDDFAMVVIMAAGGAIQAGAVGPALLEFVAVAGQAIVVATIAVGHAEVALITDPGGANAAIVAFRIGAGHGEFFEAIHFVVVRVTATAFHPEHQIVGGREGEAGGSGVLIGHGIGPGRHETFHLFAGALGGDAGVEHVHHTAAGTAAIEQGGRAAQDFDLACQQGIHRDRVIRGNTGSIQDLGAIIEDPHAWAAQATNDWPAGAAAKGVTVDTGLVFQGFPKGILALLGEGLLIHHRIGRAGAVTAQRQGGHVHLLQLVNVFLGSAFVCGVGQYCRGRQQGHGDAPGQGLASKYHNYLCL